jgi:hypothetical protein
LGPTGNIGKCMVSDSMAENEGSPENFAKKIKIENLL